MYVYSIQLYAYGVHIGNMNLMQYWFKVELFSLDVGKFGEGRANLLETSVLSVSKNYSLVWNKAKLDLQELAVKRWVDRWSVDRIAVYFGYGRTAVVRKLGQLKRNPELILDGRARSHAKSRKHRFMGRS